MDNISPDPSFITPFDDSEFANGYHQKADLLSDRIFRDADYFIGLICLATSLTVFGLTVNKANSNSILFDTSVLINYVIALFYSILLLVNDKMKFFWKAQQKEYQPYRLLLWFIWIISCFTLNREFNIFNSSANWLSVAILISAGACLLYSIENILSKFCQKTLYVHLGASTILWGYYAIYLSWLYPISIPAFLLLGLSFHSFVPFLLFITHIRIVYQNWKKRRAAILAGLLLPATFIIYFCIHWYIVSYNLRFVNNVLATRTDAKLPSWVILGQIIGNDWITERIIKSDLVYQVSKSTVSFFPNNSSLSELSQHDPLVLIASRFGPEIDIERQDRIKLLEVMYDARHNTQERLWTGENLRTENVITQARIYPEYRMAYTEKTISVSNQASSRWNQQEAVYTFYLPEGSVISSLSLWISGKEEKGYLTTKTKAETAYKAIVGIEQRDPSVIHWQEGNTVTVKIFPCTIVESRRFKIGITSPLKFDNNKLIYENIYFKGPASDDATETIKLDFSQSVSDIQLPFKSESTKGNGILARGTYRQSWNASLDAVPLSKNGFSFNGKSYRVRETEIKSDHFDPDAVYLDVNSSWTKAEFDKLNVLYKTKSIYVDREGLVKLNETNLSQMFEELSKKRYTLFPIYEIKNSTNALLITKGTSISPNLKDIRESDFANALKNTTKDLQPIRVINIGGEVSHYLQTLAQFRIIRLENRSLTEVKHDFIQHEFAIDPEANTTSGQTTVKIGNSGVVIQEIEANGTTKAPDHLLRLFAYNHILQQIGQQYLSEEYLKASELNSTLIDEAAKANVVTPVSSLIVLETRQDYDRFGIKKNKNSLDNATLKNSGAVPEPHEWALIILFALLVTYYSFRTYVR